jgi:hypothetical protein
MTTVQNRSRASRRIATPAVGAITAASLVHVFPAIVAAAKQIVTAASPARFYADHSLVISTVVAPIRALNALMGTPAHQVHPPFLGCSQATGSNDRVACIYD